MFCVFDGHGGPFAADFAKDILVKNIYNKIIETTKLLNAQKLEQKHHLSAANADNNKDYVDYDASPYLKRKASRKDGSDNKENEPLINRRDSLRKTTR